MNPVGNIIHRALNNGRKNILSYIVHERWQGTGMAQVDANFFLLNGSPGMKDKWIESYCPLPENHIILPRSENPLETIPRWVNFDLILSQHRFGQFQQAAQLAKMLHAPHVNIEHTFPHQKWTQNYLNQFKSMRADVDVFISDQSRKAWGWEDGKTILHGFDDNLFRPNGIKKEKKVISVNNDWQNRGYILGLDIFQKAVSEKNIPSLIVGDTRGLSQAASSVYDLVDKYNSASVYVNCTRESPFPCVIAEAALCGLPIVTTDNLLISDVVIDGYNGFKTNDPAKMTEYIRMLLNDEQLCASMGANARKSIQEKFPLSRFVSQWNEVFDKAASLPFKG